MKKTKLALSQKLLMKKSYVLSLDTIALEQVFGGATASCNCPPPPPSKTCPNSCILTLCNTPVTTGCPPTQ